MFLENERTAKLTSKATQPCTTLSQLLLVHTSLVRTCRGVEDVWRQVRVLEGVVSFSKAALDIYLASRPTAGAPTKAEYFSTYVSPKIFKGLKGLMLKVTMLMFEYLHA